jgi:hypothetical protein
MGRDLAQKHRVAALQHRRAADRHAEVAAFFRGGGAVQKAESQERQAQLERAAAELELDRAARAEEHAR